MAAMSDLKGVTGRARAWVRLSLEKKTLSTNFLALLSFVLNAASKHFYSLMYIQKQTNPFCIALHACRKQAHWAGMYRPHAFLLNEDHRDQLLSHFLSLTTVDVNVFTPHFPTAEMPYKVSIVTAKLVIVLKKNMHACMRCS